MSAVSAPDINVLSDPTFRPHVHRDLLVDSAEGHRILLHPTEARWALTNDSGVQIANQLDGTRTLQQLAEEISARAGVPAGTVLADLQGFVEQLRDANMIANAPLPPTPMLPRSTKPPSITIYLTEQCNLRCKHCAVVEGKMPEASLTEEEIKDLIDQHTRNYTNPTVSFLGGEPMLRKECMDLLEYAETRTNDVSISTNGLLITEELAARFGATKYTRLQVSLDGADPEVHDFIRGKGSFDKTWAAIERLCRHGLAPRLTISSVLTRSALPQIEALIERVAALNIGIVRFLNLNKMRAAYTHWDAISPDPKEMGKILHHLLFEVRERYKTGPTKVLASFPGFVPNVPPKADHPCPLGQTLIVDSLGKTYNCPIMNTPEFEIGDIRKASLSEMEQGELNQRLRREMAARRYAVPECVQCAWKNFCQGGCQAYSALRTGSVYVNDEFCELRRDLYREHVLRTARIH